MTDQKKRKPLDVKLNDGKRKVHVSVTGYQELLRKGKEEFKIGADETIRILHCQGMEVDSDEKFEALDKESLVFFVSDQRWFRIAEALRAQCIIDQPSLQRQFESAGLGAGVAFLLQASHPQNGAMRYREHKKWFKGLLQNYETKLHYMRNKCRRRLQNYRVEAEEKLKGKVEKEIFDRSHKEMEKFLVKIEKDTSDSDLKGPFKCEGSYNSSSCLENHTINPYISRCARIMFTLWEFHHIIPRSHVIEKFAEAAQKRQNRRLNYEPLCTYLFGKVNIKLVYRDCHNREERGDENDQLKCEHFYS